MNRNQSNKNTRKHTRCGPYTPVGGLGFLLSPQAILVFVCSHKSFSFLFGFKRRVSICFPSVKRLVCSAPWKRKEGFFFFFAFVLFVFDATPTWEQNVNMPNANFPWGNQALWRQSVRTHSNMVCCSPRCACFKTEKNIKKTRQEREEE